jgi:hypothetical protein
MSISINKLIQQRTKGVATGFVADATNTFVNNLFRGKQQQSNILSRRDTNTRLQTIAQDIYYDNIKRPATQAVYTSGVNRSYLDQMESKKTSGFAVADDWRVKLDLGKNNQTFYKSPLLSPLAETKGVVFPYVPQLAVTHNANYIPTAITHANFAHYTYSNSDIAAINIQGDFTAQTDAEGNYMLAVIHFFRTVTKMYFGKDTGPQAGTPPPIVFLSAHGSLFQRVPVVVTSFTSTFPGDVNYLYIPTAKGSTRVPTMMTLGVTVQPVFNRQQAKDFSLNNFAKGNLLNQGYI